MKEKPTKNKKLKKPTAKERKVNRRIKLRRKQIATSMYFLLWAIFTALSLFIVVLSAIMQRVIFTQTFKEQAEREISEEGKQIETLILEGLPEWAGGNYSGYLRMLSQTYDVRLYILSMDGEVLFPRESNFDPNAPEVEEEMDFSEEMELLLKEFSKTEESSVLYEGNGEYVYASKIVVFKGVEGYLYVGESLALVETMNARANPRIVLISVFVFILSFAVTSAVAGWFTNPLTEMTKKARLLAQGNFDVDFKGNNYGMEMVELAETLNYARDELSKTDRMQKELIANVSHDFKTPLTMIKAYASMIVEISGDIPEKRNKHAQVIIDESDRLASLVNDVLDLSKISSGIEDMKAQDIDMSAYVYEIVDRFSYYRETQGYQFEVDVDEGLYTKADEIRIGQVLYNLIGNAVNYTGDDKKVFVRLKKESETTFRFSVTDTGKGIKPQDIAGIWERYYRSAETHKRPVRGTGLGLSIVKTILERHGLQYGVESKVGVGSTFYVIFPLT